MAQPQPASLSSSSKAIVLPIEKGFSDGERSTWPDDPKYGTVDPENYLKKLAGQWIQSSGAQETGQSRLFLSWLPSVLLVFAISLLFSGPIFDRILLSLFYLASWKAVFLCDARCYLTFEFLVWKNDIKGKTYYFILRVWHIALFNCWCCLPS